MASHGYYIDYLKKTDKFPQALYHRAKHEKVRETLARIPHGSLVLDAGCGIGNITDRYCHDYAIVGIDEQSSAIQYCHGSCHGNYVEASLYNIPFADNTFDTVLFLDAIEHLTQPVQALEELARVLKVGGSILICTINYANPLWFILENTWHRFFGGGCKTYSRDVHPTRYTMSILRRHCEGLFEEVYLQKRVINMELFYLGRKTDFCMKSDLSIGKMAIKNNSAPCGHEKKAHLFKYEDEVLYKCGLCGLIFTDKYNTHIDSRRAYENYYKDSTGGRFNFGIEHLIKLFRFWRAFKMFTIYPRAGRILDIGSGRGFMLYYLKKYYGYERTVGTQISKNGYEFSRNKLGLEIYDKDLLEIQFSKNEFDMVTLWHVLEHVATPEFYIDRIHDILREDGKLIVEVPNFDSWTRRITGKYWLGLDLDYHVYFFMPEDISRLLKKHHFKIKIVHTFSLEYSTFISAQSLVSRITKTDQIFFKSLQSDGPVRLPIIHLLLFILLIPFCFLINLLLYFSKKGEVIFIIAQKD